MSKIFSLCLLGGMSLLCAACSSETPYAPVTSINQHAPVARTERRHAPVMSQQRRVAPARASSTIGMDTEPAPAGYYRVKPGDTVYSVAWLYGLDYRALRSINNLTAANRIQPGEWLQISDKHFFQKKYKKSLHKLGPWQWPARGVVAQNFSKKTLGNKGINISGSYAEPVTAAQSGIVVYSGAGVRGYGNLILIKHNESFLSAYAFNMRNLVSIGDRVNIGQRIALMGRDNAGRAWLHFEIRKDGKPVNPARYLHY